MKVVEKIMKSIMSIVIYVYKIMKYFVPIYIWSIFLKVYNFHDRVNGVIAEK